MNSNVEEKWRWLEGNCNPADLGTRSNATPQDMIPGSEYQIGKTWMASPENTWPCKKSFSPAPEEEFRKDMLEGACNVVKGLQPPQEKEGSFPTQVKGGLERLVRIYNIWVRDGGCVQMEEEAGGSRARHHQIHQRRHSRDWISVARMPKVDGTVLIGAGPEGDENLMMLVMDVVTEENIIGVKRKLIVIASRGKNQIEDIYGQTELPVLARGHLLSKLYKQAAHEKGHEGSVSTLHRSRRKVWITNGT